MADGIRCVGSTHTANGHESAIGERWMIKEEIVSDEPSIMNLDNIEPHMTNSSSSKSLKWHATFYFFQSCIMLSALMCAHHLVP
jgi:hypothetical protein